MPQTRQHIHGVRRPLRPPDGDPGVWLTQEGIERFLQACQAEDHVDDTMQWYRRGLNYLYDALPEDKTIRCGALERWREDLLRQGSAPGMINSFLSVNNLYMDFVGRRKYQLANQLKLENEPQPELMRAEMENNVRQLVEQKYDRLLEQEQIAIGWGEERLL